MTIALVKPAGIVGSLNWASPQSHGVTDLVPFLEGSGFLARNLASPANNCTVTGAPTWAVTPLGKGVYCTGGASFNIPDHGNIATGDFTVRVIVKIVSWPGGFTALFDKGTGARECSLFFDTSGNVSFAQFGNVSGPTGTMGMVAGGTYDLVVARIGTTVTYYLDGVAKLSTTCNGGLAQTAPMTLGRNSSGGGSNADAVFLLYECIIGQGWTAEQARQAYAAPWDTIKQPRSVLRAASGGGPTYTLAAAAGAYTISGVAAGLLHGFRLGAAQGSYVITGNDANLSPSKTFVAAPGAYVITGNDVTFKRGYVLKAATGSYALTGNAAALKAGRVLTAAQGSYALTGVDAGLKIGNRTLTAQTGVYNLTGNAATLSKDGEVLASSDIPRRRRRIWS